ncbi:chromosome segregation ATPase [Oxalobacteraceae bacterium GrIS 1.11]
MIRTWFTRVRDYLSKMQLQADLIGWEIDLAIARRQTPPMPELEKILNTEIGLALAMIENIDARHPRKIKSGALAGQLHHANNQIGQLQQRLHEMCERCADLQQHLHDAHARTNAMARLVADDRHAATFQSLGQYRASIKHSIVQAAGFDGAAIARIMKG